MNHPTERSLEEIVNELKTNPKASAPVLLNEIGMKLIDGTSDSDKAEEYLMLMLNSSCLFEQTMGLFYLLVCDKELSKETYDELRRFIRNAKNKEVYSVTMEKVGDFFAKQPHKVC